MDNKSPCVKGLDVDEISDLGFDPMDWRDTGSKKKAFFGSCDWGLRLAMG